MLTRGRNIVNLALAKAETEDTLNLLDVPRYETKTTEKEEREKAIEGKL